eukprot:scaffold35383_cov71-Phaeocystis_antarctica.AAC.1
MVAWEVNELERYAGAPSYLRREECSSERLERRCVVREGTLCSILILLAASASRGVLVWCTPGSDRFVLNVTLFVS